MYKKFTQTSIGLLIGLLLLCLPISQQEAQFKQNLQQQGGEMCGTMLADKQLRYQYPHLGSLKEFNDALQHKIEARKASQNAKQINPFYTIPIVFHIVHDGEAVGTGHNIPAAQVQSQIDVLNDDFRRMLGTPGHNTHPDGADVEIEFCLATTDPSGNPMPESGINRIDRNVVGFSAPPYEMVALFGTSYVDGTIKPTTIWNPNDYYNVWVLEGSSIVGIVAGYAQFPENPGIAGLPVPGLTTPANTDGVVVDNRFFGTNDMAYGAPAGGFASLNAGASQIPGRQFGRTLTHETGHWLGLFHVWGNCIPFFTPNCCGTGQTANGEDLDDYCNDTPDSAAQSAGCPTGQDSCPGGGVDMTENYMDYSDGNCQNIFTQDQKTRMQTVMVMSQRRIQLASSTVCGACTPQTYYVDIDMDGAGDPNNSITQCPPAPVNYVSNNSDCDDTDPNNFSTNTEICDGQDNDCDGQIDEGVQNTYYADTDMDSFGDPNNSLMACTPPMGYVLDNTDCDDTDPNNFPNNTEICDGQDNDCDGQIDEGSVCAIIVELELFLQGAYVGNSLMKKMLWINNLLPLNHPYDVVPWNYLIAESVATYANIPADVVDWILIELRDPMSGTVVASKAGFLREDGVVLDLDGSVGVGFPNTSITAGNAYEIIVRHRNHLDVMSSVAVTVPNVGAPYALSNPTNVMMGNTQLVDLGGGIYGLHAGDVDGNGVINVFDFNDYATEIGASPGAGYTNYSDCTMDGNLTVSDFNTYQPNASKIGVPAIRY